MAETPIEITYLPDQLRQLFTGILPESSANNTQEQREANFLSRALAAYSIYKLANCSLEEAADSVVDGGGDGGIDAIYYSATTSILWVAQSKYISNGRGEPSLNDVNTFKAGLDNLLQGKFEFFRNNERWQQVIPSLRTIFEKVSQIRPIVVYSGINFVSEDRRFIFEDLKRRFNIDDDYVDFQICNLTTIHDWLLGNDLGLGIQEVDMKILNPCLITRPYETILGQVSFEEIFNLYRQYGKKLVTANIRAYKGQTSVNEQIIKTVREEPENFFYLNNGLTAYCERLSINNLDRANSEAKQVTVYGFSIINGAQTLGAISNCLQAKPEEIPDGNIFIKIISLQRCVDERLFAERITRSTNFQNQIGPRDFVAQDGQQQRIADQLKLAGISYHFKDDIDTPTPDNTNFTLEEATTALACLVNASDCDDFCARILRDRKSLWSMELIYPEAELLRSRYAKIFRLDHSARTVWRAVQVQRVLIKSMRNMVSSESGARKDFFKHVRWVILQAIFIKLRLQQGENLSLIADEVSLISQSSIDFSEKLWNICLRKGFVSRITGLGGITQYETPRTFRAVFCSTSDCRQLRGALLAELTDSG